MLFVDDEPSVLEGLVRVTRLTCPDWITFFTPSALEAMRLLATEPIDVVVSDLRMPGMSGDELQREVLLKYPWVIRIILSGMVDEASVARGTRWSERYLTKPCAPQDLRDGVLAAIAARDLDRSAGQRATDPAGAPPVTLLYLQERDEDFALLAKAFAANAMPVSLHQARDHRTALALLVHAATVPSPDLVVVDLARHQSNGIEFLARYRTTDEQRLRPVIVLGTDGSTDPLRDPVSHGAAMAFPKPATWEGYLELARLLAQFAERAGLARGTHGLAPSSLPPRPRPGST